MASEGSVGPRGNGGFGGRRHRHYCPRRDSVALQHPRLRSTEHTCSAGLCGHHFRLDPPVHPSAEDSTLSRRALEDGLLHPRELREVRDQIYTSIRAPTLWKTLQY